MGIITLTTDFGTADPYVGQMKGVILGIAPDVRIVDLTHDLPPQDIVAAALAVESAIGHFPDGTIHVAVVDPGVGTDRAPIAVSAGPYHFVGPDNGLFTAAVARLPVHAAVRLTNPAYFHHPVSRTFHGRDIFAPVAAHLATGVPLKRFGEPVEPIAVQLPEPWQVGETLELHVIRVDRFGNLITDLTEPRLRLWLDGGPAEKVQCRVGSLTIRGISTTFGDVEPGRPLAYFGSGGRLEIAVREGSAASHLDAARGSLIRLDRH